MPKYFPRELLSLDLKLLPSEFIKGEPKKNYYSGLASDENAEKDKVEYNPYSNGTLQRESCPIPNQSEKNSQNIEILIQIKY